MSARARAPHSRSVRTVSVVLALALGVAWATTLRPTALGGPATFAAIAGTSMEPLYETGDLVVARRSDTYDIGDVIVYDVGGELVIHRIVAVAGDGYVTQGDNRSRIDPWIPTDDHIAGKAWLHLPRAGHWLARASEPALRALLIAAVAVAAVGPGAAHVRRRHRRRARRNRMGSVHPDLNHPRVPRRAAASPAWTVKAIASGSVVLLLSLAVAIAAWTRPTEGVHVDQAGTVEQQLAFEYTAAAASPSLVYPDGAVGPVTRDDVQRVEEPLDSLRDLIGEGAEQPELIARPPAPLYRELIERLEVDVDYRAMVTGAEPDLLATIRVDGVATTREGWEHRVPLVGDQPLDGLQWGSTVTLDLSEFDRVMARQAELVGAREGGYRLAIEAVVTIAGELAGQPVEATHRAELAFEASGSTLEPASGLGSTDVARVGEPVVEATRVGVGPLAIRTATARWVSVLVGLVALIVVAFSGSARTGLIGDDPSVRVKARYGSMLVTIPPGTPLPGRAVPVGSVRELARLAKAEGGFVLHERHERRLHRYLVPAGDVVYVHVLGPDGGSGPEDRIDPAWNDPPQDGDDDRARPSDDGAGRLWS